MPSTQQRKVKPLEGVVYLRKSGNIHGRMKLATWIFSGVRNSVPKPGSNKNPQQPIFHVLREFFTWLVAVPYAGVSPGAYKELRIPSSSLLDYGWSASCYWVDKLLAPYTHLHKRTCPSWCGKTTKDRLEHFWSTTNITSPTFRLSVVSLHFLWVLRVAPRNYQLGEEIVKKRLGLKLSQNKTLCALITKSLV